MAQAEIVGSIGDVCVRRADAELFRPAQWLNDTCISAYFELLMTEKYHESDVLLLPGSMAFFMSHAGADDVLRQLQELQAFDKLLIVLAMNDNSDVHLAEGGSHWTLLAFCKQEKAFWHCDSCVPSGNGGAARALADKMQAAYGDMYKFMEVAVPQQQNAYDCGMHVLVTADVLCSMKANKVLEMGEEFSKALQIRCQPKAVAALRRLLLALFI